MRTEKQDGRLAFILTEEDTNKVIILSDYMEKSPSMFFAHCIDTLWRKHGELAELSAERD